MIFKWNFAFSLLEILLLLAFLSVLILAFLKGVELKKIPQNAQRSNITICNTLSQNCVFSSGINSQLPFFAIPNNSNNP